MKQGIPRRSPRQVTEEYATELLRRPASLERDAKLMALETVAFRMNWKDLYNKLRFRKSLANPEKWWDK